MHTFRNNNYYYTLTHIHIYTHHNYAERNSLEATYCEVALPDFSDLDGNYKMGKSPEKYETPLQAIKRNQPLPSPPQRGPPGTNSYTLKNYDVPIDAMRRFKFSEEGSDDEDYTPMAPASVGGFPQFLADQDQRTDLEASENIYEVL